MVNLIIMLKIYKSAEKHALIWKTDPSGDYYSKNYITMAANFDFRIQNVVQERAVNCAA